MSNVVDAREVFAGRAATAVKLPACAPNLRFLQDLCAGVCRTYTGRAPVKDGTDEVPVRAAEEISDAVSRNVHGVESVDIHAHSTGWRVTFTTLSEDESTFVFSFLIRSKWIVRENQDQARS